MTGPDAFREQLETVFRVDNPAGAVPLRLTEVDVAPESGGMLQFSLFFHGPADRFLPQGTYALDHDAMGTLALFIVPVVGSNRERIVYQACFSCPAPARS
jgi:hypothetical protein